MSSLAAAASKRCALEIVGAAGISGSSASPGGHDFPRPDDIGAALAAQPHLSLIRALLAIAHRGRLSTMTTSTTTSSLATRLAGLSDQNKQTVQLIYRLAKLQFQPGSTPLDGEEGDVRVELSSEIHDSLKLQEEELEFLRQEVEEFVTGGALGSKKKDSEKEREKSRLSIQVARLGEGLKQ